jgi:hypothetical protein
MSSDPEEIHPRPALVSEQEELRMTSALAGYRLIKQPSQDAFNEMLKALQSPFTVTPLRCVSERANASSCLERAAALGADGKHGSNEAMSLAALKCRPQVEELERCSRALEAAAMEMMREGHRKMVEQRSKMEKGPRLPTDD